MMYSVGVKKYTATIARSTNDSIITNKYLRFMLFTLYGIYISCNHYYSLNPVPSLLRAILFLSPGAGVQTFLKYNSPQQFMLYLKKNFSLNPDFRQKRTFSKEI